MARKHASYIGLEPSSEHASAAARGASRKRDTKPELVLRKALWRRGLRYRKNVKGLPGKPDIVFVGSRLAVFCDGDFWHGRDWKQRRRKLERGSNSDYWIAKIERNMERDREVDARLADEGWRVLRFWESEILQATETVVERIRVSLAKQAEHSRFEPDDSSDVVRRATDRGTPPVRAQH